MFSSLMKWMQANHILPKISDTERQALEAGTVWIDGEIFSGNPDFKKILAENYNRLSDEERAFIDGPVEALCRMLDVYEIRRTHALPDEVLAFIKSSGMMGFQIAKEYGGKQFSRLAISTIMAKLGVVNATAGTFVVIGNSLGAAELITHYGTDEQKKAYLPKLAAGEYVPCFGLTEPTAGSDAAGIQARGDVFKDGDEVKIRLNFRKRFITLAPVADLATIACTLHDPEHLLGPEGAPESGDYGITCVLVHRGTPGFTQGHHHQPIGDPFYNGPLVGEDVVVPVDNIVGGAKMAGQGWRMLMEQLAGGRMISLPAGAIGAAKLAAKVVGPYSLVRQQFGIPIGYMEGVEDKVGKTAALVYMLDGARVFGCSAIDAGQQPPVVSAVMKAYSTTLGQQILIDSMDVFAGTGVMQGPNNILGYAYQSAPVGVTVEGANILTRTLMIFGQGATRCHPYALNVVNAVEANDVAAFKKNLLGWIGHFALNCGRSAVRYLTRGWSAGTPVSGPTAKYFRRLAWVATRFAVLTDLAMFTIGGKLKVRGKLTGRYADVLAWSILATGALRRYEAEGRQHADLPLVRYAVEYALAQIQDAFDGIYANFGGVLGLWLKTAGRLLLRLNPVGSLPRDDVGQAAARTIQGLTDSYERLTQDVFVAEDGQGADRLLKAFRQVCLAQVAVARIQRAQHQRKLPRGIPETLTAQALAAGVISAQDAAQVEAAYAARLAAVEVDEFTPEQYFVAAAGVAAAGAEAPTSARQKRGPRRLAAHA
ncbi:MAG: acyl-CoA dehydrogenase [Nevskiaceae bacterium]|nr:MAG: acyl-CoA dehydrogenase [Nevskiaceae bacterium]TBR74465.1 MAG: acyl-CoA dehydrogenase [Nevskiaceae bacterium]